MEGAECDFWGHVVAGLWSRGQMVPSQDLDDAGVDVDKLEDLALVSMPPRARQGSQVAEEAAIVCAVVGTVWWS